MYTRIALTGLNPHAGESGTIGLEERDLINPVADRLRQEGLDITDARPADTIFAEMLEIMLDDSVLAIVLTLVVVTTVLLIDLRNFTHTLLVLTPLLTALLLITGFMYLFEIRLNLYNMVAFPTVIGMGIDNGVHMFHRYREEGAGSLKLVLRTTGVALLATSLTTMVGFSGLIPANHPALPSIGILSLIGLGCCFVTAITLLPALLQIRENRNRPHR